MMVPRRGQSKAGSPARSPVNSLATQPRVETGSQAIKSDPKANSRLIPRRAQLLFRRRRSVTHLHRITGVVAGRAIAGVRRPFNGVQSIVKLPRLRTTRREPRVRGP